MGLRLPRNRCGGLRTSPDGPRAERFYSYCYRKPGAFPEEQAAGYRKVSCFYPFKRATAEAGQDTRRRSDAKKRRFSGCAVLTCERPIGKRRGSSPKGAGAFSVHFWASKSEPVGDKTAPRAPAGPFGKPRGSGAKPPLKKQTAPLPHKETKAHTSSAVPLFLPRKTGPLKAVI